jgi:hypothetical protein
MMEAVHCSKTSALTRATWRNIPEVSTLLILLEFAIAMKLVWLIKMCLNETYCHEPGVGNTINNPRKLHNEELRNLTSIIRIGNARRMRLVGLVAQMRKNRTTCRLLVRKPKRNTPLGRPRHRWTDNIKWIL